MSFGKQSAPAAPNYAPIAESSEKAAQLNFDLGQQQLDWARDQFAQTQAQQEQFRPYIQDYLTTQTAAAQADSANAQENQQRGQDYYSFYNSTYKPIEQGFAQTALNYASPERAEQRAGMAMADVSNQFEAQRKTALASLESYGIDPSQTRYGALDLSSRIAQAAATAAAGTQSHLNTEATGLALQGEAINTGRGYASNISQAYSTSTNAGNAGSQAGYLGAQAGYLGTKSATDVYSAGAGAMGTPGSYFNAGTNALNTASGALNYGYNNAESGVQMNNQNRAAGFNAIGGLVGGALGFVL